jgi:hypothetical protein
MDTVDEIWMNNDRFGRKVDGIHSMLWMNFSVWMKIYFQRASLQHSQRGG